MTTNLGKEVESAYEAELIAIRWASDNNQNATRCEGLAASWFDAGKDPEQATIGALRSHLTQKMGGGNG